jgi:putative endopeptidase
MKFRVAALNLALVAALGSMSSGVVSPAWAHKVSGIDLAQFSASVRPQDDLFKAVNGRWLEATEIPADKSNYGVFTALRDKSDADVKAIVEELAAEAQAAGSVNQKIADFFKAYTDLDALDRLGLAPAQAHLARIDAIKNTRELAAYFGQHMPVSGLPLSVGVEADMNNPEIYALWMFQGGLGLPDRDYYLSDDARMVKAREAYVSYMEVLLKEAGSVDAKADAAQVLALETELAKAQWTKVELRDPQKMNNPMTLAQIQALAPGMDWRALFSGSKLAAKGKVIVGQPSYFKAMAQQVAQAPLAQWKLYLKVRRLDASAELLHKPLREAHFAFHGQALMGQKAERPRWQKGIEQLNGALGEALGQVYVQRYFPAENKTQMKVLVNNLLAAYKTSIDGLTWMSPKTKAAAHEKLSTYVVKIGYPDQWRNYGKLQVKAGDALGNAERAARFEYERTAVRVGKKVDRAEWGMTPQTVNAYYNPLFNEIVFPAAILQAPFFDMKADDAVNYGAIGAVIGHEISHGFDDQGSQFDAKGRLRSWWTKEDREAFDKLCAQLVGQFDAYEPLPGKKVNGQLTLGENIADLSGLQIAYKAYQLSLGGKPAPVMDGLTGDQRFFMGWAQAWRIKMRDEAMLQRLTTDPHSPGQFRANGAVVNHDGFHEAFGTRQGDGMFKPSEQRIRIW